MRNNALTLPAVLAFAALLALPSSPTFAAGGEAVVPPTSLLLTPEQEAAELYHEGLRIRDKAWKLEEKAADQDSPAEKEKLAAKLEKHFEKASKRFSKAVEFNPALFQANSSLGYSLRRLGRYEEALVAYDRALDLNPYYAEAIEYRAEAYLALNRLDDVKKAYMLLFAGDRARADELFEAVEEWLAKQKHGENPIGVEGENLDSFAEWFEGRSRLAEQTAQLSSGGGPGW